MSHFDCSNNINYIKKQLANQFQLALKKSISDSTNNFDSTLTALALSFSLGFGII